MEGVTVLDSQKCKNCGNDVSGNFCSHCGQTIATHRFSLNHIFGHDFIHGIFHYHKGFLFTIKELFTRPGHSIRAYVEGKRVNHFNYFTLLILLIVIVSFVQSFSSFHLADITARDKELVSGIENFRNEHPRILLIGTIPVFALISFLIFSRAKQNFAEHFVLNAYLTAGKMLIGLLFAILTLFVSDTDILRKASHINTILMLLYGMVFYYQYFSTFGYQKLGLIFRSLMATFCFIILIIIIILIFESFNLSNIN